MTRPNLGYSNYFWIRQDQKAAQKRQSELNSELKGELSLETPLANPLGTSESLEKPLPHASKGDDMPEIIQDSCETTCGGSKNDMPSAAETQDSWDESTIPKHEGREALQESLNLSRPSTNNDSLPRLDSWLPARVPASDKK